MTSRASPAIREKPVAIEKIAVLRATGPEGGLARPGSATGVEAAKAAIVRRRAVLTARLPWPTSPPRRSASSAPSASVSRIVATPRRSRPTSAGWKRPSPTAKPRRSRPSTARWSRRSTRRSRPARCTATPVLARSPAPRASFARPAQSSQRTPAAAAGRLPALRGDRADRPQRERVGVERRAAAGVELEIGQRRDRRPQRRDIGALHIRDERGRGLRRHPQLAAQAARRGPLLEPAGHRERLAQASGDPVGERFHTFSLRAQLEEDARGAAVSWASTASASVHAL